MRIAAVCIIVLTTSGLVGCSRSQTEKAAARAATADVEDVQRDAASRFDSASLVEVSNFADLPEDLRKAIRAGKVPEGRNVDNRDMGGNRIVIVAGVSKTSALVGYEAGDYVPQHGAIAYVLDGSRWVLTKEWGKDVTGAHTLSQLIFITDYLTNNSPVRPRGDQ
jgi:hypothetical protein